MTEIQYGARFVLVEIDPSPRRESEAVRIFFGRGTDGVVAASVYLSLDEARDIAAAIQQGTGS